MRILYLGDTFAHCTSAHRAQALRRMGHTVLHVNPRLAMPRGKITGGFSVRFGFGLFSPLVLRYVKNSCGNKEFDLAWIDGGAEIGPVVYRWLKARGIRIINYSVDDPFGNRDGKKWALFLSGVPLHDLTVVVREENIREAKDAGAKSVERVFRSYDPVAHQSLELTPEDWKTYGSEVSFIGTWMPERGPLMARLIELGVPLTLRGDWWQKASEWPKLKSVWKGPGLYGRDFAAATQCSKVALGLLSKGNRDRHTTRSAEVPFMGGPVFCAERTDEHQSMFEEGKEALFWSSAEECAKACQSLLANDALRRSITRSAKQKIEALELSNDKVMAKLLKLID